MGTMKEVLCEQWATDNERPWATNWKSFRMKGSWWPGLGWNWEPPPESPTIPFFLPHSLSRLKCPHHYLLFKAIAPSAKSAVWFLRKASFHLPLISQTLESERLEGGGGTGRQRRERMSTGLGWTFISLQYEEFNLSYNSIKITPILFREQANHVVSMTSAHLTPTLPTPSVVAVGYVPTSWKWMQLLECMHALHAHSSFKN